MAIGIAVVGYKNAGTWQKERFFTWLYGFNVYNAYP
jgi:hypothetical protein